MDRTSLKVLLFEKLTSMKFQMLLTCMMGYAVAQLAEALHYQLEGHGFDS
jgi:hypothetical protein